MVMARENVLVEPDSDGSDEAGKLCEIQDSKRTR